jgi:5'-nucleotidase
MRHKRPNILITNDDGIDAPGIWHLWNAIKDLGNITIVAPESEKSSMGMSITLSHPLRLESVKGFGDAAAWSVSGTPADCVKIALNVILEGHPPDILLSGINRGGNAGRNVLYSGTVAGAIEAVMQNIPGVALSCCDFTETNYGAAAPYIPAILSHALTHPLPKGTLLNINFPSHKAFPTIRGFKLTRQGKRYWRENPEKRHHPTEKYAYYWLGAKLSEDHEIEESDIHWLSQGYVTGVPLHIAELTDHQHLQERRAYFENLVEIANGSLVTLI